MSRTIALAHLLRRLQPFNRVLRDPIAERQAGAHRLRAAGDIGAVITRRHPEALLESSAA